MKTYRVKAGDTLGSIAKKVYGERARYKLIVNANELANPDKLKVGQVLVIPDIATPIAPIAPPSAPPRPVPAAAHTNGVSRTTQLSLQRLNWLHPIVKERGLRMLELCEESNLGILITQGLRTWKEQDELYAKGRTAEGKIVTNAKGGQSFHNYGLAFDIVVLDTVGKSDWNVEHPGWSLAATLGKSTGLEWGGDWKKFKDMPHFQYTGGLTIAQCLELCPDGGDMSALWARIR